MANVTIFQNNMKYKKANINVFTMYLRGLAHKANITTNDNIKYFDADRRIIWNIEILQYYVMSPNIMQILRGGGWTSWRSSLCRERDNELGDVEKEDTGPRIHS